MIKLDGQTSQDFLNRKWVMKFLILDIDMSDAKYCLYSDTRGEFITCIDKEWGPLYKQEHAILPTYSTSELRKKVLKRYSLWTLADKLIYKGTKPYIGALAEILIGD